MKYSRSKDLTWVWFSQLTQGRTMTVRGTGHKAKKIIQREMRMIRMEPTLRIGWVRKGRMSRKWTPLRRNGHGVGLVIEELRFVSSGRRASDDG